MKKRDCYRNKGQLHGQDHQTGFVAFGKDAHIAHTSIAALFTAAKRQRQLRCPATDEWINKMRNSQTMGYYSTLKRNEIPIHAVACMNLENIVLCESVS